MDSQKAFNLQGTETITYFGGVTFLNPKTQEPMIKGAEGFEYNNGYEQGQQETLLYHFPLQDDKEWYAKRVVPKRPIRVIGVYIVVFYATPPAKKIDFECDYDDPDSSTDGHREVFYTLPYRILPIPTHLQFQRQHLLSDSESESE
jgi:hypothetical protein